MSCTCQGCGSKFRIDFMVPGDIWERIQPKDKPVGAGLLCGVCICSRMEAFGEYGAYELIDLTPL